jgi:choline transporter-like protein 2/4/5
LILCSAGIALVVAFLYTWLLRGCASFFIWGLLTLAVILVALLAYCCFHFGVNSVATTDAHYDDKVKGYKIAGGVLIGVDVIAVCVIIFLRERINLAIAVVKDSGRVLQDMPALALFPIWPIIVGCGYLAFWLYVMLTLYSVGTMSNEATPYDVTHDYITGLQNSNPTTMVVRHWDSKTRYYVIAHFFGLLWQIQFLVYLSYMVMAGTVANWYFTPSDAIGNKPRGILRGTLPHWPICASAKRTFRYHIGTLAFGSLIIAVIQFARTVLLYIQKTTSKRTNCMTRCLLSCAQCCLKCMQTFIDKVSKNAFVWTSIYATGFCQSSCLSFALIWRNLARTAALSIVSGVLVFFGKVLIVIITTAICAAALIAYDPFDQPISSPLLPLIVSSYLYAVVLPSSCSLGYNSSVNSSLLSLVISLLHYL